MTFANLENEYVESITSEPHAEDFARLETAARLELAFNAQALGVK